MEIKYTGKFIEQFNASRKIYKSILDENKSLSDEIKFIISKSNKLKVGKLLFTKEKIIDELKNKLKKDDIENLFFYKSILSSYNKSKGQWLEDISKYILEKTNKFELKNPITWQENIIFKFFLKNDIRLNNKYYSSYSVIKLNDFKFLKKLSFNISGKFLNKKHNNLINFLNNNVKIKKTLINVIYKPIFHIEDDTFECILNFKDLNNKNLIFELFINLKLLAETTDISKLKTDITYFDKINKNIIINELKNNEFSVLDIDVLDKVIAYSIREKTFSKCKFNKVFLIYTGDLTINFLELLKKMNNNLKAEFKFTIELQKFPDYLDYIKLKYFDNEVLYKYKKKNITCWDFDKFYYRKAEYFEKRKYMPIPKLENRNDNCLILELDYSFIKPTIKYKISNEKQELQKKELSIMSSRFQNE